MKWKLSIIAVLVAGLVVAAFQLNKKGPAPAPHEMKIGVFQVVRHPVLDAMATTFQSELKGKLQGPVQFVTEVADNDPIKTEQMAQKFSTGGFDLVFVIGTGQAKSLSKKAPSLPIVLGGATDPVAAKLVASWEKPGGNITGTSDLSPVGAQLDRLREILPMAKRVGMIYNPLEENSKIISERFKTECAKRGITPVTATVSAQNEIKQTFISMIGKIDALYAPTDATIQESFSVLSKTAKELKLPVFNCDKSTVQNGAVFSVGFNYEELGRVSAEMARQILIGKVSPAEMPIRLAERSTLFYNPAQIKSLGLSIPASWKQAGESVP